MSKQNKSAEKLSPRATPAFCLISFDRNSPSRICWRLHFSTDCLLCSMFSLSPSFISFVSSRFLFIKSNAFLVVNETGIVFAIAADVLLAAYFKCETASVVDSLRLNHIGLVVKIDFARPMFANAGK